MSQDMELLKEIVTEKFDGLQREIFYRLDGIESRIKGVEASQHAEEQMLDNVETMANVNASNANEAKLLCQSNAREIEAMAQSINKRLDLIDDRSSRNELKYQSAVKETGDGITEVERRLDEVESNQKGVKFLIGTIVGIVTLLGTIAGIYAALK